MRVVLRKAAHPKQTMQRAAPFIAIDRAQLSPAQRQVAVGARLRLVDHDVKRAIHGLDIVLLALNVHRRVHAIPVKVQVPRRLPQVSAANVRRKDNVIPAFVMLLAPVILDQDAHPAALGMPVRQPRSSFLVKTDQVELPDQFAMIACLNLF